MNHSVYFSLLIMCLTVYCIRMLPFLVFRKEITNRWLRSFLYYVPYVTLAVMTFPAIITATDNVWSSSEGNPSVALKINPIIFVNLSNYVRP